MENKTCEDCKWFDLIARGSGLCRKRLPEADAANGKAVWPEVIWNDWCGELQVREDEDEHLD